MKARHIAFDLSRRCRSFAADRRAVSSIEFALLLPLMLTMYFGSIEITDAISADRKVTLVSNTVAQITSQSPSAVSSTDVSNILSAASAVLAPFPVANAVVTLSSVVIDQNGNAAVDWSQSLNGTARAAGSVVTNSIPASLRSSGTKTSVIWGEATYNYTPSLGYVITGTLPMYNQIFVVPRMLPCVQYTGVSTLCPLS